MKATVEHVPIPEGSRKWKQRRAVKLMEYIAYRMHTPVKDPVVDELKPFAEELRDILTDLMPVDVEVVSETIENNVSQGENDVSQGENDS